LPTRPLPAATEQRQAAQSGHKTFTRRQRPVYTSRAARQQTALDEGCAEGTATLITEDSLTTIVHNKRRALAFGIAFALLVAGAYALLMTNGATQSRADVNDNNQVCSGFIQPGTDDPDDTDLSAVNYRFRCEKPITGYSIFVPGHEVQAYETEVFPVTAEGDAVASDSFSCSGELPGQGINCVGLFSAGAGIVTGQFSIGTPLCDNLPGTTNSTIQPILTVVTASVSSANKAVTAIAGPFALGKPGNCPAKAKVKPKKGAPRAVRWPTIMQRLTPDETVLQ